MSTQEVEMALIENNHAMTTIERRIAEASSVDATELRATYVALADARTRLLFPEFYE